MAIDLTLVTKFGVDSNHNVIEGITVNNKKNTIIVEIVQYSDPSTYNNDFVGLKNEELRLNIGALSPEIKTKINELKSLLEIEIIDKLPVWSGGTQTMDDGTLIT